jgi:transcriptional regulator with XRE-family HTH domain
MNTRIGNAFGVPWGFALQTRGMCPSSCSGVPLAFLGGLLSVSWVQRDVGDLIYTSPMADHQELGIAIRKARLDKSMSLGQLASAVGRSSSSVRRWERGEVVPAPSVLPKLAAILEIDPEFLKKSASPVPRDATHDTGALAGDKDRVSTVEQPSAGAAASGNSVSRGVSQPLPPSGGRVTSGPWAKLIHGDRGWMGWLRGSLTLAVLVVLFFVMLWAVGELFSALSAVLDSFNVGSDGGQSP